MNFDAVPAELRALPQWVVWRYVARDDGKFTKLPYNPHTLGLADVSRPETWSTFDHARGVAQSTVGVAGIGFVLTEADPYCFTDLDDPYERLPDGNFKHADPDATMAKQRVVYEAIPSYAELSPSGKGLHIISRGAVPDGKRRGGIELYSSGRYMTVTGNVYRNVPITSYQPQIDWLYNELRGNKPTLVPDAIMYTADKLTDEEVVRRAFGAANGAKFQALWEGRWQDAKLVDNSWSAADFALIDILQFHTTSRQQISRLFFQSALAKREKAHRPGYVEYMIQRSFDRVPVGIDIEQLTDALEARRERETLIRERAIQQLPPEVRTAPPAGVEPYTPDPAVELAGRAGSADMGMSPYLKPVDGLLGAIAWFIYSAAPRPVPEIAMAGAIGLLAGITGRAYNVNSTGLNVYVLMLAKTGRGKEAIASGISRLMGPVKAIDGGGGGVPGADEFLGPQEIASGQALIKYLAKTSRSFVSIVSEFDTFLAGLTATNVSPSVAKLKQVLLYAYSRSGQGQRIDKSIYSESDKNVPMIPAPAVSFIGECTPERFYELLNDDLVGSGFLPRFSVIEYVGPRTPENAGFAAAKPDKELVKAIATLSAHCLTLNSKDQVQNVAIAPDAKHLLDTFNRECDEKINSANNTVSELWNRAHLKALKLAALIAVGVNWYAPTIDFKAAEWAIACSRYDTSRLAERFNDGRVGIQSADALQMIEIRRKLTRFFDGKVEFRKYGATRQCVDLGIFTAYYLQSATSNLASFRVDRRGSAGAYNGAVKLMLDMGVIDEVNRADKERLGLKGSAYLIKDWEWLRKPFDD